MYLSDLDDMILKVRNVNTREYFSEAVRAYQTGAYRSAIMSLWISVVYDIISKIRELQIQNDKAAAKFIEELDNAIQNKNIVKLQTIEQSILKTAKDLFQFISEHEYIHLEGLRQDRHSCAHPAFVEDDILFQPTPELVRSHLKHCVKYLLQHQPVQGKSALERIFNDLKQISFPTDQDAACKYLETKYLKNVKDSLVKSLVKSLLKEFFYGVDIAFTNIKNTLIAIKMIHPETYKKIVSESINILVDNLDDEKYVKLILLISVDNSIWLWLNGPNKLRTIAYIENSEFLLKEVRFKLENVMDIDELQNKIYSKFLNLDIKNKIKTISKFPHPVFNKIAVQIYKENSKSYRGAEEIGNKVILPMAEYFTTNDIADILEAVCVNDQIRGASGTPVVLEQLFELTKRLLPQTSQIWKEFGEGLVNQYMDEDAYYSYPELRKLIVDSGIKLHYKTEVER